VFDGESGKLLGSGEGGTWSSPAISVDNRLAVAIHSPRAVISPDEIAIYSLPALKKLLSFPAHVPGIKSLSWSPAGDRLATGASGLTHPREEESIRVWDASSGARLAGFVGEFEPVVYLKWHPSGKFFVTSSAKGTGEQGALVQLLPADGGTPLLQHFAPNGVVVTGPCFCPRTGLLAWHDRGQILIHEIQGL
jgi:WD40 repeat protein